MNLKVVVGLLVGLLVVQIIGAIIYFFILQKNEEVPLTSEINQTFTTVDPNSPANGSIKLQAERNTISINDELAVSVVINTDQRAVEGVDLVLKYDSSFVQPVLVNNLPFVPGRLFPDVPVNVFDNKIGTASMSAISLNQNFLGEGTLGLITFKAKKSGTTVIKVQAEKDNTTDTNMVADGKEILNNTEDLSITIER